MPVGVMSGASAAVIVAGIVWGLPGLICGCALEIAAATTVWLQSRRRVARRALSLRTEVAHACTVLAAQVAIGKIPAEALSVAATDCPVLADAEATRRIGGDVVASLRQSGQRRGMSGLIDLARAWEVSVSSGAPMATSLAEVANALDADQTVAHLVEAELSAPRATGRVMAALPAVGVLLGYLIGGNPLAFLIKEPIGWVCLISGTVLAALGVIWIERLAEQAGSPW